MNQRGVNLGVIGCGGFGLFALQHFAQVSGVRPVAMAGTHRAAAIAAAARFGIQEIESVEELVERNDVDLIYIATPPFLHYPQAMAALEAGKHVICEKPLAMTLEQADAMIDLARRRDCLVVANMMQRYNPLFDAVKSVIEQELLGQVLHGYFENYASDENLPPEHWFWDRSKSGGLFIEHGVHFFDMLAGWLGPGEVLAAQAGHRPGSGVEEQVQCAVRYDSGTLFNFYHGFHQTGRMDRQELRLVFERGDITLHEWIPSRYRVHAIVDEAQTRKLCECFHGAHLDVTTTYGGDSRKCRGRNQTYDVYQMIELYGGEDRSKMHRYGDLLRSLMIDQLAWIRNHEHRRRLDEHKCRAGLAMGIDANSLSANAQPNRCMDFDQSEVN